MCGIAGIVSRKGRRINREAVSYMTSVLAHRGPDGEGIFLDNGRDMEWNAADGRINKSAHPWPAGPGAPLAVLGHRRLAIIDLSANGHQPMTYAGLRYWIVFNGEIYNYRELRDELRASGCVFSSETDTEVLLAAFSRWGDACFNRFNGMWAIAIWDSKTRCLLLSRDRFGIKPLYYILKKDVVCFASEPKALVRFSERRADQGILGVYLCRNRIEVDPERTFFSDIRRVPSGSILHIAGDKLFRKTFFDAASSKPASGTGGFHEHAAVFRQLLDDSVRLRLNSDVPVGSCLSGGLDSSAVVSSVSILSREGDYPNLEQAVITAHHSDPACDELPFARIVANHFNINLFTACCDPGDFLESCEKLVWHQDEPFPSFSIYAQWSVFREARKRSITVMLDGQGADELLGGYEPTVWEVYFIQLIRRGRLSVLAAESASYRKRVGHSLSSVALGVLRRLTGAVLSPEGFFRRLFRRVSGGAPSFARVLQPELVNAAVEFESQCDDFSSTLEQELHKQFFSNSLPALLRYEDRNSMAHSIEARVPFLDHRLVENAFAAPCDYKLREGWTKALLREAMKERLPERITKRAVKQGFPAPLQGAISKNYVHLLHSALNSDNAWIHEIVRRDYLRQSLDNPVFLSGLSAWRLLGVELWARAFLCPAEAISPLEGIES